MDCVGTANVRVSIPRGQSVLLNAVVVKEKPLGFAMILGMDGLQAFGGVTVRSPSDVRFSSEVDTCAGICVKQDERIREESEPELELKVAKRDEEKRQNEQISVEGKAEQELKVEKEDFCARFDRDMRCWVVSWKWTEGSAPTALRNVVPQYAVPANVKAEYHEEIDLWVQNGWLLPYEEDKYGPPKGLIPMMAVIQQNKNKVRPVLDFREMNTHVETYTADMDVCSEKLREWRKMGRQVAMLDLRKAYLQIHVEAALWPYQTVILDGKRYCLTRLGFGLNVAPRIMKTILETVTSQDPVVDEAVSSYIDDLSIDERIISAEAVASHLSSFGLECKPPIRLTDGGRALGLRVSGRKDCLRWTRDNDIGEVKQPLTRRNVFSLCGRLTGHLPVCGWLRPAASYIKRCANEASSGWDDLIEDSNVGSMIAEVLQKIDADDPAKGRWDVEMQNKDVTVWTDASSLALGVAIEVDGEVVEDGCWLRREDGMHINVAELDAVLKGVNTAILWGASKISLITDSRTVYHWILGSLTGKKRLKTKAASEMLIRRRLSTLEMLAAEYSLKLSVQCVPSAKNRADVLTRVPERWLRTGMETKQVCFAARETTDQADHATDTRTEDTRTEQSQRENVLRMHEAAGHPGVRRTHFFSKRTDPSVTKSLARSVVQSCQICQSIDPAPVKWKQGQLSVESVWWRLGMDITRYGGRSFLTLIDCGPSRFAIWRPLRLKTTAFVVEQLNPIFMERGAPEELLVDNDPAFRSRRFEAFAAEWGVRVRFRCAYLPSGNGIVERSHRTVKTIAARKDCSIGEAVFLYNNAPQDNQSEESTPANQLYQYRPRAGLLESAAAEPHRSHVYNASPRRSSYEVGDPVWVRPPGARCYTQYTRGVVTGQLSEQAVEVDGMPRHVRELRHRTATDHEMSDVPEDDGTLLVSLRAAQPVIGTADSAAGGDATPQLRRSERLRNRVRTS